jgi:hypothetical protein
MTPTAIMDEVKREVGAITDDDMTAVIQLGFNAARRKINNLKGGKLKFLRATQDLSVAANQQYSTLSSDTNIIWMAWNITHDQIVEFQDEKVWRQDNGFQTATDTGAEITDFLLDAPLSSGLKQIEWVPIPSGAQTVRLSYWKILQDTASADFGMEITDVPLQFHSFLEAYCRWYTFRHISKAQDLLAGAERDWKEQAAEMMAKEDDTSLRNLRIKSRAEVDRADHRADLGFSEGEY